VILEQCRQFEVLVDRYKQTTADVNRAKTLDPVRERLREWRDKLTDTSARARVLQAGDPVKVLDPVGLPGAAAIPVAVEAVRAKLAADPFKVTDGKDYKGLLKTLDDVTERLRDHVIAGWRAWVDRETARIDAAELARYERLPDLTDTVAEIRRAQVLVADLPGQLPATAADLAAARAALERLRAAIGQLPRTSDPAVKAFLDAASKSSGAALDLLTGPVRQWLKENNMYAKCRIVVR
jgi:hypothetical protein